MTLFEINILWLTIAPSFYGLMYVVGIFAGYYIIKQRKFIDDESLDNLLFYIFLWIILWGRLWYVLFYNFQYYFDHILEIFQIWKGGMSFHGGLIWVIIGCIIFAKRNNINFYKIVDELAYVSTIGLFFGRIGNYYNKELLGFKYAGPLSIEKNGIHYFPTPLLEATLEGLLLFVILSYFYANRRFNGQVASLFVILYGCLRLWVELWFRMPDKHIGYIIGNISMGGMLSIAMISIWIGFYLYLWLYKKDEVPQKHHKKSKK